MIDLGVLGIFVCLLVLCIEYRQRGKATEKLLAEIRDTIEESATQL